MIASRKTLLLAVGVSAFAGIAQAQAPAPTAAPTPGPTIHVGVVISLTGPAAALGAPQRNSVALLPTEIAGHKVEYIVLDDATDATRAVADARKLIDESNVDAIIGSSTTPSSQAMIDVAAERKVPLISMAASESLIRPMDAQRAWVFKTPQNDSLMADAIATHMAKAGIKTAAFIGFNDSYGDGWLAQTQRALEANGVKLVDTERFARTDTSVTGQVLKIVSTHPDAVLIAGSGTPAALPQRALKERGYAGHIYQTHGVAVMDFIRVGGKDVEGTILPAGPVLVASQLPDSNPVKAVALDYIHKYEAANGVGSVATFGAHAYDAALLLEAAIPGALLQSQPGTAAFRAALRDGIEAEHGKVLTHGVADMSPTDHNGFDGRARVMVEIHDGGWKLLPQ
jgi:branched-chain amino acid transport system substrate-binding protein